MAKDPKQLFAKALVAIEENKLFFIEDVSAWLGIAKPTIYKHFKIGSNEMNAIKDALESNRIRVKVSLRAKLAGGRGMEIVALYKLIGTDEERKRLSMTEVNVTNSTDGQPEIDLGRLTKEQRAAFYELYNLARIPGGEQTIDIDHEEIDSSGKALGEHKGD